MLKVGETSSQVLETYYIHTPCGDPISKTILKLWLEIYEKANCPNICPNCKRTICSMEEFVDSNLLLKMEELAEPAGPVSASTSPMRPNTPVDSHIDLTLDFSLSGKKAENHIGSKDPLLFTVHIDQKDVEKVFVDSTSQFAVVSKLNKWCVYRIGDGSNPAKKEHKDKNMVLKHVPF